MRPRAVDWALALALAWAFGTGLWSLSAGRPEEWWIVTMHGVGGLWLALLLVPKLRRVWRRLRAGGRRAWPGLAAINTSWLGPAGRGEA